MRYFLWIITSTLISFGNPVMAELLSIEHEGLDRKVWLENTGEEPRPLIVFLHGYRDKERQQKVVDSNYQGLAWEKLDKLARSNGFAVAYPSSLNGRWGVAPHHEISQHPQTGQPLDDVGFVKKVVDRLIDDGKALKDEVYLVGYSNGSRLSFYFMCQPDHPFAAVVTLTGSIHETVARDCNPKVVPYMALAGTNDRILGYDGWLYPDGRTLSTPETMDVFVKAHGCRQQSWHQLPDTVAEDQSKVRLVWWRDCDTPDGSVRLLRVEGGGHTIPQPEPRDPEWVKHAGGENRDLEMTEYIWDFFSGSSELPASE